MSRQVQRFFLMVLLSIICISDLPPQASHKQILYNKQPLKNPVTDYSKSQHYTSHILGGFSIDTPQKALKAVSDGIHVTFQYDPPPSTKDALGQKLQSLQM